MLGSSSGLVTWKSTWRRTLWHVITFGRTWCTIAREARGREDEGCVLCCVCSV